LLGIKNIGRALIDKIVASRKFDGEFISYWDFCKRISGPELNRRALECLIKAGALDGLDMNRKEMLQNLDLAIDCAVKENDMYAGGQLDLFSSFGGEDFSNTPVFARFSELPLNEILAFEKEVSGLYFSGHPLEDYREVSKALKCPQSNVLQEYIDSGRENEIDNKSVRFVCIVNSVKKKVTKRDETMGFCLVEDLFGSLEMIVFPKTWMAYYGLLTSGNVILVDGKISVKDDEIKIIAEKISIAPKTVEKTENASEVTQSQKETKKKKAGFFLRLETQNTQQIEKIKNLLSQNKGMLPVYLYFSDTNAYHYLGSEYHCQVNSTLKTRLQTLLGDENVVIRE
jgi:DNA polymerase-3 subunit alpha